MFSISLEQRHILILLEVSGFLPTLSDTPCLFVAIQKLFEQSSHR